MRRRRGWCTDQKRSCGYTELWNAFKPITANASATEKTALYSGAARVYRLSVP
jgi:L-fuconolactonase